MLPNPAQVVLWGEVYSLLGWMIVSHVLVWGGYWIYRTRP